MCVKNVDKKQFFFEGKALILTPGNIPELPERPVPGAGPDSGQTQDL